MYLQSNFQFLLFYLIFLTDLTINLLDLKSQRLEEDFSVALRFDPRVEDYHDARVCLRADQAAKALAEFDHRFG